MGGWVSSRAAFDDHKLDDDVDEVVGIGSCYWYQATRSQQHRWGPPVFGGGGGGGGRGARSPILFWQQPQTGFIIVIIFRYIIS